LQDLLNDRRRNGLMIAKLDLNVARQGNCGSSSTPIRDNQFNEATRQAVDVLGR
jgi:hypothetical protein